MERQTLAQACPGQALTCNGRGEEAGEEDGGRGEGEGEGVTYRK